MANKSKYYLVTNENGRRILVVTKPMDQKEVRRLDGSGFDAIYLEAVSPFYEQNRITILAVAPMLQPQCWLKPLYVNRALEGQLHVTQFLVDGYAETPLAENMAEGIEVIYSHIRNMDIVGALENVPYDTERSLVDLCRFALSRGMTSFSSTAMNMIAVGYTRYYVGVANERIYSRYPVRRDFHQKLLDGEYIRRKRFIERMPLCPFCFHSHLLFAECCPECECSELVTEPVLHHFRCANVSPESTYLFGGQLRCPKCKKFLRHIGVDYDEPARVYICQNCRSTFVKPRMKVVCLECGQQTKTSDLRMVDNIEYEFTEKGIRALASNALEIYPQILNKQS